MEKISGHCSFEGKLKDNYCKEQHSLPYCASDKTVCGLRSLNYLSRTWPTVTVCRHRLLINAEYLGVEQKRLLNVCQIADISGH